jgi:ketosteroid isomerase-like protein
MLPVSEQLDSVLHEVVETLAPLERTPCSAGEREAAEWLAERMRAIDGVKVALEDEPSWGTFPPTATGLGIVGVVAAALLLRGRRAAGALLAAGTYAGILDEAQNGPRILRRIVRRRRSTVNVVARAGDHGAMATLVVLAHHDAPQTGVIFDQTLQRRIYERAPQLLERFKTPPPQWWFGLAGPLCTLAAALSGRRGFARAAVGLGALATGFVADVWRNQTVPGANDNLSGVAALVALAEMLREHPLPGLRVLLVSCGAEETLQDGIRAFMASHRDELELERTWFVNLDTIGSPHLVALEAEGPAWMESYAGPWLRDDFADCAERLGVALHRGYRARASTDSIIPSRAGYPIVTLVSMTDWFSPANYHLPSDVPENLDYGSVADATRVVYELARMLAQERGHDAPAASFEDRLRGVAEAFTAGGIAASRPLALELYHPDIEYHDSGLWPGAGTYNGREAVMARFEELTEVMGMTENVTEQVVQRGDELAWVNRIGGRSPGADVPQEHRWGWRGRMSDGKLVYLRAYYDADEALADLEQTDLEQAT